MNQSVKKSLKLPKWINNMKIKLKWKKKNLRNRFLSPKPCIPKILGPLLNEREHSPQVQHLFDTLDKKVMIARSSRFAGFRSPNILNRVSKNFTSLDLYGENRFRSMKNTPILLEYLDDLSDDNQELELYDL